MAMLEFLCCIRDVNYHFVLNLVCLALIDDRLVNYQVSASGKLFIGLGKL